jgi:two-component system, NarL family, response regulator NreC
MRSAGGIITVVMADDHPVVRSVLRLLLEAEADLHVVAEVGDADAALRAVVEHEPTLLVPDLEHAGRDHVAGGHPAVRERSPGTAVVVLTMQTDPAFARHALRAGALACVLKESANADLVEAVRGAAAGQTYVAPRAPVMSS